MDETRIDTLTIEIGASSDKAVREIEKLSGVLSKIQTKAKQTTITPKTSDIEDAEAKTGRYVGLLKQLSSGVKKRFKIKFDSKDAEKAAKRISRLSKLLSSLKRVAFYRAIRTALKALGDAFREGQENAYWYSKTVGEETKHISEAYDNLASSNFKMKNQLGAAWATLRTAITPVLLEIVSLITQAANAITQFFAVLSGKSTYLKAIDYAKDWADETNKGAKAAKEWKNQLLGFDVINRLEEPSSGGGGASALTDYENMFEEAKISQWAEKIKPVLSWTKDHMELIKDLAIGIGVALAAWKLGNFVAKIGDILGQFKQISELAKTVIGLGLAVAGALVYVQGFMDAWKNGPDWDNIATMIGGVALAAIGLGIAFGPVAAGIALVVGGIGMLVIGIKDIIKNGPNAKNILLTIAGGVSTAMGAFMLFSKTKGIIGSATVGASSALKNMAKVIAVGALGVFDAVMIAYDVSKLKEAADTYHEAQIAHNHETEVALSSYAKLYTEKGKEVADKWAAMVYQLDTTNMSFEVAQKAIAEKVETYWDDVPQNMWEGFKQGWNYYFGENGKGLFTLLGDAFQGAIDWVKGILGINSPSTVFYDIGANIVEGLKNGFSFVWSTFTSGLSTAWNDLKTWWNGLSLKAPEIKGGTTVNTQGYSHFSGTFATGGFPEDGLFYANSNELVGRFSNGRTAVANNEQITEGISRAVYSAVVSAFGQGNNSGGDDKTVNIYLDGKQIAQTTTKYQRQFARVGNA